MRCFYYGLGLVLLSNFSFSPSLSAKPSLPQATASSEVFPTRSSEDTLYSKQSFLTATRSLQRLSRVTENVTVITREELDRWPVADLDEAMGAETVLGILRSRLEGDPWKEPGAVLAYHAGTKRILARQRPEVHLGIHAALSLLRREGACPFDMGKADAARADR